VSSSTDRASLLARRVEVARRATAFAVKQSAIPAAMLLGGLAVPALALTVGWRWAFAGGAVAVELKARRVGPDAASQLKRYVDIKDAYHIKVDKRIPAGAGLGGGSSNAALTLRLLNKIEELGLSDEELIDLSRDLGADVPLFIKGQTGIGSGVGHEIKPLDIQPNFWIITCFPNVKSSTPEAYSHCQPNPEPDFDLEKTLTEADPAEWQYTLFNDLEQSVVPRHHVVGNMKDQFYEFGALYASMSGSGSAVYGLFEQDFVATNAYHGLVELEFPTNITKPGFKPDHGIYRKE
jgi:4-diphosphocytidyl-2-C-methyl-D-erythritol kinase